MLCPFPCAVRHPPTLAAKLGYTANFMQQTFPCFVRYPGFCGILKTKPERTLNTLTSASVQTITRWSECKIYCLLTPVYFLGTQITFLLLRTVECWWIMYSASCVRFHLYVRLFPFGRIVSEAVCALKQRFSSMEDWLSEHWLWGTSVMILGRLSYKQKAPCLPRQSKEKNL